MLYIIRGLPGAGKTTLAHKLSPNVVEADDFMVNDDGEYEFDPSRLGECHAACFAAVEDLFFMGAANVAVSNTFVSSWEYERYIKFCDEVGIMYQVISVSGHPTWENTHGVPASTIQRMKKRWMETNQ